MASDTCPSQVRPDKFQQTKDELTARFGAVSLSAFAVIGTWVHEGTRLTPSP